MHRIIGAISHHLQDLAGAATDSRRVFHGRGQTFPGLEMATVDWFDPLLLVTLFKPMGEGAEQRLVAELQQQWQLLWRDRVAGIALQQRYAEGTPTLQVCGVMPADLQARRGAATFALSLDGRQNSGFFLDIEPGRQWLEQHCRGRKVLNLFAYTCAFSVVAQQAGAASVVNVDMSNPALAQGRDNHRRNGLALDSIRFVGENILKSWSRVCRPGPYDVAIIDPPSFQRGSFVAASDYAKVLRRIPQFMQPGGDLLICLNAPELDSAFVQTAMADACPDCQLIGRLPAHADFPDINPEQQLKLFHYRYSPAAAG
jgi:23S rRNA (cytosine1962-C5)-methyltransferase